MRLLGKTAIVLGMAGAMALGSMTASEARWRGAGPAAAGFVAGAAIGAAAANANAGYYYGSGYGYDDYAYAPGYSYDGPAYRLHRRSGLQLRRLRVLGYSNYGYNNNLRERQLEGRDY